ncbi:MAG: hypothetical protein HC772_14100 [Leptolyngbyaceae cyanobacterium CRU_2_3]|nr:hypothetical protein [Leptolyngbyaceae cyanobacterium CRU_2_3]
MKRFWEPTEIRAENFKNICRAVGIPEWEAIADWSDPQEAIPDAQERTVFYIERSPIEALCYQKIAEPGALIRIKAPSQMGKTSLLNRLCNQARQKGYQIVRLNLREAEKTTLSQLDKLLNWFCIGIRDQLKDHLSLTAHPRDYWDEYRGSKASCKAYFQEQILKQLSNPLVLAMDGVDWIFPWTEVSEEFFSDVAKLARRSQKRQGLGKSAVSGGSLNRRLRQMGYQPVSV